MWVAPPEPPSLCLSLNVSLCAGPPGVLHPLRQRQLLRTRGQTAVRGPLPPISRELVPGLPAAHPGPLRHRHGRQVPPQPPCVSLLPEAAEQGMLQGAGEQALLPPLLHKTVWLRTPSSPVLCVSAGKKKKKKLYDSCSFLCGKEGGAGLFSGLKNISTVRKWNEKERGSPPPTSFFFYITTFKLAARSRTTAFVRPTWNEAKCFFFLVCELFRILCWFKLNVSILIVAPKLEIKQNVKAQYNFSDRLALLCKYPLIY